MRNLITLRLFEIYYVFNERTFQYDHSTRSPAENIVARVWNPGDCRGIEMQVLLRHLHGKPPYPLI